MSYKLQERAERYVDIIRNGYNMEDEFEVNSFTQGWLTATLTLDEAVRYCEGELSNLELEWEENQIIL